jgi:hypothetical protein
MTGEENLENTDEPTVTEEWVDENVTSDPTVPNVDDDSVSDCCCDKRVTIDNGNWCIKLPRRNMTVKESIEFLGVIEDILSDNVSSFGENYDGLNSLLEAVKQYKKNALFILYSFECIQFISDVSYNGDKL